jgi:hypothetical protein
LKPYFTLNEAQIEGEKVGAIIALALIYKLSKRIEEPPSLDQRQRKRLL